MELDAVPEFISVQAPGGLVASWAALQGFGGIPVATKILSFDCAEGLDESWAKEQGPPVKVMSLF